jgi:tetratricopeptide (TPR) repeat protein
MAELLLGSYARGEDPEGLWAALELLEQAARLEPGFWKIPYQQARFSYMACDLDEALARADQAVSLDPNPLVLNNLGTLQFCAGDFSAARASYQHAGDIDPDTFIGEGQLAVIDYVRGRFDDAVEGFAAALEKQRQSGAAEDHRLWGNYADALRHAGRQDESRQAYATAIALAERHVHDGDSHPMHAVSAAYSLTMLGSIDPNAPVLDSEQLESLRSQSDRLDAIYKIYLGIVHEAKGLSEQARILFEAGAQVCPGLAISPDIVSAS